VPLRVRLLGRPGLEHDGASRRLEGHKPWALLTYLLLEPRAPTRRELADLLWSEADDPLGAVRWSLSQVRKAVNPPADIGERDGRIKIDAEVLVVDAGELLRGEWDETSIDDLVRGELLEGMSFGEAPSFDTWLQMQRARVATSATDALRWAATLLSHRDPDRALALAERALRSEPFDDVLHELIVEIHTARGDRERARTYVAGLTRRYRDELSIEPPASISRPLDRPARTAAEPLLRLDVQARALLDIAKVRFWAADFASARHRAARGAPGRRERRPRARSAGAHPRIDDVHRGRARHGTRMDEPSATCAPPRERARRPRHLRPDRNGARPDLGDRGPVWSGGGFVQKVPPPCRSHRRHEGGRMGNRDARRHPRRSLRVRHSRGRAARRPA